MIIFSRMEPVVYGVLHNHEVATLYALGYDLTSGYGERFPDSMIAQMRHFMVVMGSTNGIYIPNNSHYAEALDACVGRPFNIVSTCFPSNRDRSRIIFAIQKSKIAKFLPLLNEYAIERFCNGMAQTIESGITHYTATTAQRLYKRFWRYINNAYEQQNWSSHSSAEDWMGVINTFGGEWKRLVCNDTTSKDFVDKVSTVLGTLSEERGIRVESVKKLLDLAWGENEV